MLASAIEHNCYMDDLLLSSHSLTELKQILSESLELFESRGFSLHRWAGNSFINQILLKIPRCDLATCVKEVNLVWILYQTIRRLAIERGILRVMFCAFAVVIL